MNVKRLLISRYSIASNPRFRRIRSSRPWLQRGQTTMVFECLVWCRRTSRQKTEKQPQILRLHPQTEECSGLRALRMTPAILVKTSETGHQELIEISIYWCRDKEVDRLIDMRGDKREGDGM